MGVFDTVPATVGGTEGVCGPYARGTFQVVPELGDETRGHARSDVRVGGKRG